MGRNLLFVVFRVEKIVLRARNIEKSIRNEFKKEVTSTELGNRVMEALKDVDEVAYVRFASVYRQFKDVSSFMEEVNKFIDDRKGEK